MADKKSPGQKLRDLIATGETILLPGAHDPLMGRIVQRLGFKACICAGLDDGRPPGHSRAGHDHDRAG